jgi:hypothetical protein
MGHGHKSTIKRADEVRPSRQQRPNKSEAKPTSENDSCARKHEFYVIATVAKTLVKHQETSADYADFTESNKNKKALEPKNEVVMTRPLFLNLIVIGVIW